MELLSLSSQQFDLIVVGGGAAGFMAAITAAEQSNASVLLLEATRKPLDKVRISGGGRCNVTHACWDPSELITKYPRGGIALYSPFTRFACGDSISWFAEHGVELVVEEDGRMFPKANTSLAIVNCLKKAAKKVGVKLLQEALVSTIRTDLNDLFIVTLQDKSFAFAKKALLATGGHPSGRKMAKALGHNIIKPIPSLFTFKLAEPRLNKCSGISLDSVKLNIRVGGECFEQLGRVLITHWGISGPAVLRLTAYAARALHKDKYKAKITINWLGNLDRTYIQEFIRKFRHENASKRIKTVKPFSTIPKRFWLLLLSLASIDPDLRWADFSYKFEQSLIDCLINSQFRVEGRGPFGEEFVTAGGVELDEIDLSTMESRICSGLYIAGELLDVDGITGGFNFQHCWSSGWLAGKSIANAINKAY
ncbi:NAD(P)/FAD-dependent oxidoreductase [Prochlorococcus sp. MIT 1300]|uniref:NAD(P)/FAD-dependent oxidoreductase n=1 Tax=Prochlorococcus sp. MIT 1300 TaxID=3096218 RepID=UPI002A75A721|nr:NAD(P)/FAD-dependent oxidoreductase [Prochlorococcus sp. MIT 1300]